MSLPRRTTRLLGLAAGAALAVGLAACESDNVPADADLIAGKKAFVEKCGACHVLARANTGGRQGPDLDAAFRQSLRDGLGRDTIHGVVVDQILYPADVPEDSPAYMPAKLVTGKLAGDVAAYVAAVAARAGEDTGKLATAAVPPVSPDDPLGKRIFVAGNEQGAQSCGNCHKLADAGTNGATGPDLDELLKGDDAAAIERAIVQPSAELTPGFGDLMPKDYGETLSDKELKALVEYLVAQARK